LNTYFRIARGEIESLDKLDVGGFAAVVFPGGFGAAKNLSNFAFEGPNLSVNEEVEKVLKGFHTAGTFEPCGILDQLKMYWFGAGKPIALCCIAPILAAKVFGSEGVQLTLGRKGDESKWPYGGALDAASVLGAKVVEKDVDEVLLCLF
jgi:enhancing lycopene biosynthesis protein 2